MKNILSILSLSLCCCALSAAKAPNFIIIYTDDLGYADTSVQMMDTDPSSKHTFINTPGLERLADLGARFNAGYAPTPTCTGSRLSIRRGFPRLLMDDQVRRRPSQKCRCKCSG